MKPTPTQAAPTAADSSGPHRHEPRANLAVDAAEGYRSLLGVERFLGRSSLDPTILELVKLRASQINGCAYCLDMHGHDALAAGESVERLLLLAAWREAPGFTAPERAALELTEAITRMADQADAVPDALWERTAEHFDGEQRAALILAIATINAWNAIAVTSRSIPGSHRGGAAGGVPST